MEVHWNIVFMSYFATIIFIPSTENPEYVTVIGVNNRLWICELIYFYLRCRTRYVLFAAKQWNTAILRLRDFFFDSLSVSKLSGYRAMNVHYFVTTSVQTGYDFKSSVSTHNCVQSFCTDNKRQFAVEFWYCILLLLLLFNRIDDTTFIT